MKWTIAKTGTGLSATADAEGVAPIAQQTLKSHDQLTRKVIARTIYLTDKEATISNKDDQADGQAVYELIGRLRSENF